MDITPQDNTTTQPISDDQELAKALAGVMPDEPIAPSTESETLEGTLQAPVMQFEETSPAAPANDDASPAVSTTAVDTSSMASVDASSLSSAVNGLPAPSSAATSDLDSIKNDALNELRPLIDRVDLPAEEKFDTYLMLIRSTDDPTLIAPAHAVAQGIVDEKRKAEALLDVIKEIDYLSRKDQQPL